MSGMYGRSGHAGLMATAAGAAGAAVPPRLLSALTPWLNVLRPWQALPREGGGRGHQQVPQVRGAGAKSSSPGAWPWLSVQLRGSKAGSAYCGCTLSCMAMALHAALPQGSKARSAHCGCAHPYVDRPPRVPVLSQPRPPPTSPLITQETGRGGQRGHAGPGVLRAEGGEDVSASAPSQLARLLASRVQSPLQAALMCRVL